MRLSIERRTRRVLVYLTLIATALLVSISVVPQQAASNSFTETANRDQVNGCRQLGRCFFLEALSSPGAFSSSSERVPAAASAVGWCHRR
jgi:hypothetical protein